MNKIMGVDLGEKRTGIALSSGIIASSHELIEHTGLKNCAEKILKICAEFNVNKIILGYPINMNGTIGKSAERAIKFKEILKELNNEFEIVLFDERLSSSLAHVYLNSSGAKNKKAKVDMLSAQIILQNYLDSQKNL